MDFFNFMNNPNEEEDKEIFSSQNLENYVKNSKKEFNYINDDDLSRSFEDIDISTRTFNVHLCLYSINTNCYIEGTKTKNEIDFDELNNMYVDIPNKFNEFYPFLLILLENGEFPSFQFDLLEYPPMSADEKDDVNKSQQQISFETSCFTKLNDIIGNKIHDIDNIDDISILYKGFIDDENNIYAFFDITPFHFTSINYNWTTIDEILYKKVIYSTPISPLVTELFDKYTHISNITNKNGNIYPFPFQLYLCKKENGEYNNITIDEANNTIEPIEDEIYARSFYFSTYPVNNNNSVNYLQRFACFIVKGLYIIENGLLVDDTNTNSFSLFSSPTKEPSSPSTEIKEDDILGASTIYFHDKSPNETQLWSIKNISQFTRIP